MHAAHFTVASTGGGYFCLPTDLPQPCSVPLNPRLLGIEAPVMMPEDIDFVLSGDAAAYRLAAEQRCKTHGKYFEG